MTLSEKFSHQVTVKKIYHALIQGNTKKPNGTINLPIGLVDDEVVAAGTEIDEVAARSLELAGARTAELVTIYRGADVSDSDASRFSDAVQTRFPNLLVESMMGGQPHYDFIISVE